MEYQLKLTEQYVRDLDNLPSILESKRLTVHKRLENNPQHPGLNSHLFRSTKKKIFRSFVADNYRIVWHYGSFNTIVLLNIGTHKYIDGLYSPAKSTLGSYVIENDNQYNQVDLSNEESPRTHSTPPSIEEKFAPIFRNIRDDHLEIMTVPIDKIEAVKKITDIDDLHHLNLPFSAYEFLIHNYTNPNLDVEDFDFNRAMYRANSDEIEAYCSGEIKKLMLDLSPEQEKLSWYEAPGAILIKGVAGSGKTTIGVYQIINKLSKQELFSAEPFLFLTYNVTLANVIKNMFLELLPKSKHEYFYENVIVKTLRDFCCSHLTDCGFTYDLRKAQTILNGVIAKRIPKNSKFDFMKKGRFIQTEISQVIKGRNIESWNAYKSIARVGMVKQLLVPARELVWDIYLEYQKCLEKDKVFDETDLIIKTLKIIDRDTSFKPFAHIVLDEAQDFPPIALNLAVFLAGKNKRQSITLLADPLQSIYYKGIPWKDGGIEIHSSRVKTLEKNYRNSKQILEAAWAVAKNSPKDLEDIIEPSKATREHLKPRLVYVNQQSDKDMKMMKEYVLRFVNSNKYRLGDTAILCKRNEDTNRIKNYLESLRVPVCHFREENFDIFENDIKVITIHSAKGLEFPNVILMNIEEGVLPRNLDYLENNDEFLNELSIERQLFYVAMTRAADNLVMISRTGQGSRFLDDIPKELLDIKNIED